MALHTLDAPLGMTHAASFKSDVDSRIGVMSCLNACWSGSLILRRRWELYRWCNEHGIALSGYVDRASGLLNVDARKPWSRRPLGKDR